MHLFQKREIERECDWKRKVTTISITHFSWMHFYRYLVAEANDKTENEKVVHSGKACERQNLLLLSCEIFILQKFALRYDERWKRNVCMWQVLVTQSDLSLILLCLLFLYFAAFFVSAGRFSLCSVCIIQNIVSAWRVLKISVDFSILKMFQSHNWTGKKGGRKYLKLFSIGLPLTFLIFLSLSRLYLSVDHPLFCAIHSLSCNIVCDFQVCISLLLLLSVSLSRFSRSAPLKLWTNVQTQNKQLNLILC